MLHDPKEYPEPTCFRPERYLKDGKLNPAVRSPNTLAFGFGRRICPGRYLSSGSLFMTIASILHTFDIHEIPDDNGKAFDPFSSVVTGLISTPDHIPCKLIPRSDVKKHLIDNSI
ncbi:hypothetical protein QCA50_018494 [Cerrena zonata]|uniref:Cytochrome P450 n=1 Tax=Cerrena zonata TaxID=2478898 RepID=A0AAW0FFZ5_9APHY